MGTNLWSEGFQNADFAVDAYFLEWPQSFWRDHEYLESIVNGQNQVQVGGGREIACAETKTKKKCETAGECKMLRKMSGNHTCNAGVDRRRLVGRDHVLVGRHSETTLVSICNADFLVKEERRPDAVNTC